MLGIGSLRSLLDEAGSLSTLHAQGYPLINRPIDGTSNLRTLNCGRSRITTITVTALASSY